MYHRIEEQRNLKQNPKQGEKTKTKTKTFYALTSGFSTDHFKSEKPTEVPNDCTVEEREVVSVASRDGRFELPLGWKWFVSVASRDGRFELPLG